MNKVREPQKKPRSQTETAMERIELLFQAAERESEKRPDRSRRYVELASKIAMRYNLRLPKNIKRSFCKICYTYLVNGRNCRVRYSKGIIIVSCSNCGHVSRYPAGGRSK